jgi:translation elongation factor EF-Tu-like GTPase
MARNRHIEARIYFLKPDEGGRHAPVFDGYRGQFFFDGIDVDATQEYPEVKEVKPGDEVIVYLAFIRPEVHLSKMYVGKTFLVREGARTVGRGVVTKVLDSQSEG